MTKLQEKLLQRQKEGNIRRLQHEDLPIDFYSNDYLGLARNRELAEWISNACAAINDNRRLNGSTGSRLLSGNDRYFQETEEYLASLFKTEKTLLFNSGYNANLAVLSSIPQKGDTILYDELIHASVKDGARLSFAKRLSFKHNDLEDLIAKLKKSEGEKFVVVESVYSMDGDFSPLKKLVEICRENGARLIVDEAHSTGIWGNEGSGLVCELGLENEIFARIHTFGKAMGVHGACVGSSAVVVNYLINFARPFIYTTSLPLHSVAAIQASFRYLGAHTSLQEALHKKIKEFSSLQGILSKNFIQSSSGIQALKIPGTHNARALAHILRENGIDVRPILAPTVKEGEERLRICLHLYNTSEELNLIFKVLSESYQKFPEASL